MLAIRKILTTIARSYLARSVEALDWTILCIWTTYLSFNPDLFSSLGIDGHAPTRMIANFGWATLAVEGIGLRRRWRHEPPYRHQPWRSLGTFFMMLNYGALSGALALAAPRLPFWLVFGVLAVSCLWAFVRLEIVKEDDITRG